MDISVFLSYLLNSSTTFVAIFGLLLFKLLGKNQRIAKFVERFDGPFSLPVVGSTFWFIRPNHEIISLLVGWSKTYGRAYRMWVGNQANIVLSGAEEMQKILSCASHVEKSTDYRYLEQWLGLGLLTAKRDRWHSRRKLIAPAFHQRILEGFMPVFNEQANVLVDIFDKEQCNKAPFDVFPYMTRCALDIICETAMGKQINAQREGRELEYVKIIFGYGDIVVKRFLRPWLQPDFLWKLFGYAKIENECVKVLHDFTETVIKSRQAERKLQSNNNDFENDDELVFGQKRRKAFLDLLLDAAETDKSLTDLAIREETDTFMSGGHDTTAANMSWTMLNLSLFPEHQKRIQQELDEIFGEDRTRDVTFADIPKMKYLDMCIKETLRLYPSVPFFIRHLHEDCDLGQGRIIPQGTNVYLAAFCLHRDPEVFPDPEEFNPERFSSDPKNIRNPYSYIPFSAGARNCPGQKFATLEEKVILAKLLLNFNLSTDVVNRQDVKMVPDIVLRPYNGIHVKLTPRD